MANGTNQSTNSAVACSNSVLVISSIAEKTPFKAFSHSPPRRANDSPAPGHYDTDSHSLAVRSLVSHNKNESVGKGTFMRGDNRESKTSFTEEFVDPGHYADYHLDVASMFGRSTQSQNRCVSEGKIPFGSHVGRDGSGEVTTTKCNAGPGDYDFHHLYGCGVRGNPLSSLKSKSPLCGYVRKTDTPGVGVYSPEKVPSSYSYSKCGSSAFAGQTPQHAVSAHDVPTTGTTIGPDTYVQDHHSINKMLRRSQDASKNAPPFGSSSRREIG